MQSIYFVGLLHIFRDLATVLDPLNLMFQNSQLGLGEAYREVQTSIACLEGLVNSKKPWRIY